MTGPEVNPISMDPELLGYRPFAVMTLARCIRRAIHHVRQALDLCVYDDLTVQVKVPNGTGEEQVENILAWKYQWECAKKALGGFRTCAIVLSSDKKQATFASQSLVESIEGLLLGSEDNEPAASRRAQVYSSDEEVITRERQRWEHRIGDFATSILANGTEEALEYALFDTSEALERLLCPQFVEQALHHVLPVQTTSPVDKARGISGSYSPRGALRFSSAGVKSVNPGDLLPDPGVTQELLARIITLKNCDSTFDSEDNVNLRLFEHKLARARNGTISVAEAVNEIAERIGMVLTKIVAEGQQGPAGASKPRWNKAIGELKLGDQLVLKLAKKAKNCISFMDAFEEDGWPPGIDDPLPDGKDSTRLNNTIRTLNAKARGLRFSAGGNGESICWTIAPPASS